MALIDDLVARLQALGISGGAVSNAAVAPLVTTPGPTKQALDTHYAPTDDVRFRSPLVLADSRLAGIGTPAEQRAYLQGLIDGAGTLPVVVPKGTATWTVDTALQLDSNQTLDLTKAVFRRSTPGAIVVNKALATRLSTTRNANITFLGGVLERTSSGATLLDTMTVMFAFVDGLKVSGQKITFISGATGKYAMYLYNCTNADVGYQDYYVSSDGVHITGASENIRVHHVTGYTGDDSVAIMPRDNVDWEIAGQGLGNVSNISVEHVNTRTTCNAVKVITGSISGAACTVEKVRISNIRGQHGTGADPRNVSIFIGGDTNYPQLTGGIVTDVDVSLVKQTNAGDTIVNFTGSSDVYGVRLRGIDGTGGLPVNISGDVRVHGLSVSDSSVATTTEAFVKLASGAVCDNLTLERIRMAGTSSKALVVAPSGATLGSLSITDSYSSGVTYGAAELGSNTKVHLRNVNSSATKHMHVVAGGSVRVQEAITGYTLTDAVVDAGAVLQSENGLRSDVAKLSGVKGDMARNTNAANACGLGLVTYDGTEWKPILGGTGTPGAASPSATKYREVVLAASPVAFWPLSESTGNAIDAGPNGYNGTPTGTLTRPRPAPGYGVGTMTQLGIGGYFSTTTLAGFGASMSAGFTVEFIIRGGNALYLRNLLGTINTGSTTGLQVKSNSQRVGGTEGHAPGSTLFWLRVEGGAIKSATITNNIYDGNPHHVVATFSSTGIWTVYVDGIEATYSYHADTAGAVTTVNFGFPMAIGANNARGTFENMANGTASNGVPDLAAVALYSTVLTQSAAAAHFTAISGL